jgi:hypothetical protein
MNITRQSPRTLTLNHVPLSWTIGKMREELGIQKHIKDLVADARFIWGGKQLDDEKTLENYGLFTVSARPLDTTAKAPTSHRTVQFIWYGALRVGQQARIESR